mmetsp:Transcript_40283/g.106860  ORF Transcript_40283/g.106860 Transcript_40283/m.106860 type:complete len:375 (+) Transcript_40283:1105-2229(+)
MQIGPLAGARDLVPRDAGKSSAEDLHSRDTPAHSCLGSCAGGSWQSHATTHLDLSHCERRPARPERTSGALRRASSRIWSTRNASRSPQTAPAKVPPPERSLKTTGLAGPSLRHWEHHGADDLTGQTLAVYRLWKAPRLAAFLHLDWQLVKTPRENWSRTPVAVCRAAREQVPHPLGPCRQRSARHPDHWMRCFPGCAPRNLFPIYSEKKDAYRLPRCLHLVPHLKAHLAGALAGAHALEPCSHHLRQGQPLRFGRWMTPESRHWNMAQQPEDSLSASSICRSQLSDPSRHRSPRSVPPLFFAPPNPATRPQSVSDGSTSPCTASPPRSPQPRQHAASPDLETGCAQTCADQASSRPMPRRCCPTPAMLWAELA